LILPSGSWRRHWPFGGTCHSTSTWNISRCDWSAASF